jgi:hypothetical protein
MTIIGWIINEKMPHIKKNSPISTSLLIASFNSPENSLFNAMARHASSSINTSQYHC